MATSMVKREEGAQARQIHPVNETGLTQEMYSGNKTRNKTNNHKTTDERRQEKKQKQQDKNRRQQDKTMEWRHFPINHIPKIPNDTTSTLFLDDFQYSE